MVLPVFEDDNGAMWVFVQADPVTLKHWSFGSGGVIVGSLFNRDSSSAWVTFFGYGCFSGVLFVDGDFGDWEVSISPVAWWESLRCVNVCVDGWECSLVVPPLHLLLFVRLVRAEVGLGLGGGVGEECPLTDVAPPCCLPALNNYNQFFGCRPRSL